jgi:hypothetical protein
LGRALFVAREEIGADDVEGIAQCAFADIERQPQKSDDVTAKLPECQELIGVAKIESHTTSRVICAAATLPKADPLSQSARSPTFCNPTLTSDRRTSVIISSGRMDERPDGRRRRGA